MILFLPRTGTFAAATAIASGTIVRWTYTVPAGKRAQIEHTYVQINASAAAAGTIEAVVQCNIGGVIIRLNELATPRAEIGSNSYSPWSDLQAGDTVQGITTNNSAVAVTMIVSAIIREFQ